MNGFTEPLPGLLDDPQLHILNLPSLTDVHIAPLRNPAPSRRGNAPLPLEIITNPLEEQHRSEIRKTALLLEDEFEDATPSTLIPNDVLLLKEAKKPHLAISELLEASNNSDNQHLQLPSFVSLAVVEKSPVSEHNRLSPHKRLRLDLDVVKQSARDMGRRLPRPAQKDEKPSRPVPLLPAMVTGLHEPPPSAGILPSMDLETPPANLTRAGKSSKIQVKDILSEAKQSSTHVPPEAMLNTPDLPLVELARPGATEGWNNDEINSSQQSDTLNEPPRKETRTRRVRRKWSDEETADLLEGVKKHGFGKWKQILIDPAYDFHDRTSIDLKDRYRVHVKDQPDGNTSTTTFQGLPKQFSVQCVSVDRAPVDINVVSSHSSNSAGPAKANKPKRTRHPWTAVEDEALMLGLSKHGFQWTIIHDDAELNLSHRRATDLRDRVRNLFPEGYKHAEARPAKGDIKRTEVASTAVNSEEKCVPVTSSTQPKKIKQDSHQQKQRQKQKQKQAEEQQHTTKSTVTDNIGTTPKHKSQWREEVLHRVIPSTDTGNYNANVNNIGSSSISVSTIKVSGEMHQVVEQGGVTLPSLALGDDDGLDWDDTTLPPLLEWEDDIGI